MGFLHNLNLVLPKGEVPKGELQRFMDQIPEGAVIETDVHIIPKDRPWESEQVTVKLTARWITE